MDKMNKKLKKFLTEDFEKMTGSTRKKFLCMLKQRPQEITLIIQKNLIEWATIATFQISEMIVINNVAEESAELTEHLQKHFAEDLRHI